MPIRRVACRGLSLFLSGITTVAFAASPAPPTPTPTPAGPARPDLVRIVRMKLSAADLASAEAWTEDWKRDVGADATWLDARGWLARGAWMLGETDRALAFAREVRAAIGEGRPELLIPLGAALEVEGRIVAERQGPVAGVRFFRDAEGRSSDVAFRARMWKNVNRIELVGQAAPEIGLADHVGAPVKPLAERRGRPVLLFFWSHRCGDCAASAPTLATLRERYGARGLDIVAPTRLSGTARDGTAATPEAEKAEIATTLAEKYAALGALDVPVDTATMVRYGTSATPTFVLVDGGGIVRLYAPTRLTLEALSAAIEPLLSPARPTV